MKIVKGESGGAWKVAYADFVTSMMCLFLVLWVVAMNREIRSSIASSFERKNPIGKNPEGHGIRVPLIRSEILGPLHPPEAVPKSGSGGRPWSMRLMILYATLREAANQMLRDLQPNLPGPELMEAEEFRMQFLNNGFCLHVFDRTGHPIFEEGTAKLTERGLWVLQTIAWEVQRFPFRLEVEGHVRNQESIADPEWDEWDLSTRRALVAYQTLLDQKIPASQFSRVAGYADRKPLDEESPKNELNRRISIVMEVDPNTKPEDLRRGFNLPD